MLHRDWSARQRRLRTRASVDIVIAIVTVIANSIIIVISIITYYISIILVLVVLVLLVSLWFIRAPAQTAYKGLGWLEYNIIELWYGILWYYAYGYIYIYIYICRYIYIYTLLYYSIVDPEFGADCVQGPRLTPRRASNYKRCFIIA